MANVKTIITNYQKQYDNTAQTLQELLSEAQQHDQQRQKRTEAQRKIAASESKIQDLQESRAQLKQDFLNAQFEGNDGAKQSISTKRRQIDKSLEETQKQIQELQDWLAANPVQSEELARIYAQSQQTAFDLWSNLNPNYRDFEQELTTAFQANEDALTAMLDEINGVTT